MEQKITATPWVAGGSFPYNGNEGYIFATSMRPAGTILKQPILLHHLKYRKMSTIEIKTEFNGIPIRDSPPPYELGLPSGIIQSNFGSYFLTSVYFNPDYVHGDYYTVAIFRIRPKKSKR